MKRDEVKAMAEYISCDLAILKDYMEDMKEAKNLEQALYEMTEAKRRLQIAYDEAVIYERKLRDAMIRAMNNNTLRFDGE